ncbi:alpha/beta fold hydrolase [Paraburkholderia sabiae]|uniref:Proline iminopeptidase n=1 Tax=Paraburkholderia sabiae TaxID=273251 RepID=A0ABU9Q8F0_9BURK|nr:alpha/beta fold hydrolase [Paraburkholderia sabiae]WJZ78273.1 alpha/beta fold hydrolase [Paraburkholderia sabiae]CAD6506726.1 Proline iminopeptidase [Paraburkholderia sabiae]
MSTHDTAHHRTITRDGHTAAYTVHGERHGVPVVVLHGGPGSGSNPAALRLFDLVRFRVVMVDQRGTGASTPRGSLRHNDTQHLIRDLEAIRVQLGIVRWGVVGGSWGAALALAYAGTHPASVSGVVLRGLFLTTQREVRRLFVTSRSRAPSAWRELMHATHCERASSLPSACIRTTQTRTHADAWRTYENAILMRPSSRTISARRKKALNRAGTTTAKYRIQAHYLMHGCWLGERRLMTLAKRAVASGVAIHAVHGSRDPVCPPDNLHRLMRAVPAVQGRFVDAGHLASDVRLAQALAAAIEALFPARESDDANCPDRRTDR